ncbi:hypothetical protein C7446_3120 [Kushneria sinocarnis]|uniref:DUF3413 domain-containing protein n=1 Tax=Kushneria sinocarnis TaxID=595502 RepID=A0A420WT78_9GAMM|nr:DUF3413 domain-containing protein [Kushneria sinocarnis]RKQ95745.1 hypothetical protein C7446_3120 [Kushneria sinocarnis]
MSVREWIAGFRSRVSRQELWRWANWFVFFNGLLAALIALRLVEWADPRDWQDRLWTGLALPAHFLALAALALLVLWPLLLLLPRPRLIRPPAIVLATLAQLTLLIDTEVFAQYRFHLSGFIFDLMLHAGGEVFSFSALTWLVTGVSVAALLAMMVGLSALGGRLARRGARGFGWLATAVTIVLLPLVHGWHAWADAHYNRGITSLDRVLPLFYPATAKRFFTDHGWVDLQQQRDHRPTDLAVHHDQDHALDYPTRPLQCDRPAERPNVLIVGIDAWRADTLDAQATPNIADFARGEHILRFRHHLSGGNSTKAGLFSLFYGLPSTYWDAFAASQRAPVMMRQFQRDGYDLKVLGSATLTSPAFDRTAFSSVSNLRTSTPGATPWQRDARITRDFLHYLEHRPTGETGEPKPFFGFLFYDAVHGYSVPPDFPHPFQPYWQKVQHLELGPNFDPAPYYNRYRTAARYDDRLIGKILADLQRKGLLENTIVIFTSDHGEEFNDNHRNFWGHGSNFTDAQTHVPLIIHWPGRAAMSIDRTTSHMDIVPTLMKQVLGCQAPAFAYGIGQSLFDHEPRRWWLIGSYMDYAVRTRQHIVEAYPGGNYQTFDLHNRPVEDFQLDQQIALQVIRSLSRFYK